MTIKSINYILIAVEIILKLNQALTTKKVYLILLAFGFLAYFNTLFNGFVWDDEEQILNNQIIHSLFNIQYIFSGATFNSGGGALTGWFFRPLLTFSYMLNFSIWGANAFGYHLFQLTFHIINGMLLFKILQRLTLSKTPLILLNALISIIFVVHSGIAEGVNYIAALGEVMYTFFGLIAIFINIPRQGTKFSLKKGITTFGCLFLALLFKESAIVIFPLLIVLLILYKSTTVTKSVFTIVLTAVCYFFIRLVIVKTSIAHPLFSPISEASLLQRLQTIPLEFVSYLRLAVFPNTLAISQHYVVYNITFSNFVIPVIVSLAFVLIVYWMAFKLKSKIIFLGLVWYLLGFGLISNIFPLDMTIAERWFYFPFIGLCLISQGILSALWINKPKYSYTIFILCSIFILGLTLRTLVRNTNWYSGLSLYSHDINYSQNSFDLENNLGVELFRIEEYKSAKKHFERSIALQPKWHFAYNNLGVVYEKEGDTQKAKEMYQKTLELSDYYLAYENLAKILVVNDDLKDTAGFAQQALQKLPNNSTLWWVLAIAQYKMDDKSSALVSAKNAYLLQPNQQTFYVYEQLRNGRELE